MTKYKISPKNKVQAVGEVGSLFSVDPGVLMHQGARCEIERTVLFITVTSTTPYDPGRKITFERRIWEILYEYLQAIKNTENTIVFSKGIFQ